MEGFQAAMTQAVDAVVLDLMLPGRHGLDVLRDLRATGSPSPCLILTALDAVEERVQGPGQRRKRLPGQAVRIRRAARPAPRAAAPRLLRTANWSCGPTTWRWTCSPGKS